MNQEKIGIFISKMRKEKGWTQNQLAQKLGVTLNELFAGEKIPEEALKEKADQVLMEVIANWLGCGSKPSENNPSAPHTTPVHDALKVNGVSKEYKTGPETILALDHVSFQIPYGSFTGIMGASGCGKTTLLNLIATIDTPTSGEIWIEGQCITALPEKDRAKFRRTRLGFVFQEYNLLDTLTVYENIELALSMDRTDAVNDKIQRKIQDLSEALGIMPVLDKFPWEISGGQRQRCACARAMASDPRLILADEPTGALDSRAAGQLLDTFLKLRASYGTTILMVTHDAVSASYCDQILFMKDGQIKTSLARNGKSKQEFFTNILEKMAQL